MACQSNPKTYSFVVRCPLEDGAALKSLADDVGKTVSAYVAKMVRLHIGERNLNEKEKLWVSQHLEANLIRRAKADEKTANGYYKRKRRGRPRKPGPKKGWKKHKNAISDGLMSVHTK